MEQLVPPVALDSPSLRRRRSMGELDEDRNKNMLDSSEQEAPREAYRVLVSPRYNERAKQAKAKDEKKRKKEKKHKSKITTEAEGNITTVGTNDQDDGGKKAVTIEEMLKREEQSGGKPAGRKLTRRHTLSLSRRYKLVKNKDEEPLKEGKLVWRRSKKENQDVTLSLTSNILWIKKANKDDFSPFLEIININNVYMKKGTETIFPDQRAASPTDDTRNTETKTRRSLDEQSIQPIKEESQATDESEKSQAKSASKIGSMIAGWTGSGILRRPLPSSDSSQVQPKVYYSFIIEVRRKEFTTNIISYTFSSEKRMYIEAWIETFHEAIIAARIERKKTIRLAKEAEDEKKITDREVDADTNSSESASQIEPSFHRDLHSGITSVLPGETEKQRQRRLKRELREELEERKRLGKAEAKLTLFSLVTTKGYPIEEHKVTTPDGYILTLHRMPHSKNETGFTSRPVVLLMHGLMDCSVTWIVHEPHKSLGFMLADAGFDVWMGNCRGNRFSREHATLKIDSTQYWQFSRDDLVKDVRATIEYVLETTDQPHLAYAGHSQGTNIMFALLSTQPEFKHKITVFIALAPAVYVHNQKSKMMTYLSNMQTDKLFQFMGIKAFLATGSWVNNIAPGFLIYSAQGSRFVTRLIFDSMCGWNPDNNFSLDRLPVIAAHQPGGTSTMVMAHWAQAIRNKKFCKYDYGVKKNVEIYGQEEPPSYDLGSIDNAKIAVFYGGEDKLTCKEDVERLISELPKESVAYVQFEEEYGHLDFVWGDDAHIRIYPQVVHLARKYHELAEKRQESLKAKEAESDSDNAESPRENGKREARKAKGSRKKGKGKEKEEDSGSKGSSKKKDSKKKRRKGYSTDLQPECTGSLGSIAVLEQSGGPNDTLAEA